MKKKKGGDLICMRPDSIVEARFNLTKKQNDILDMLFATIENDDKLQYEIDVSKYAKLYNIQDKSNIYGDLKKAVRTFEGKGFAITEKVSEKKQNRIYFSWFSSIQYLDGQGKIILELGQTLKKLLLEVKRAIYYKIEYSINFNCIYSKRLYYYLKLYEDTQSRIDNLDILRDKLECPQSYKKYANFRRFVLEPAWEEINGNSDISYKYEEIKTGRKVTAIKFYIHKNNKKSTAKTIANKAKQEIAATKEIEEDTEQIKNVKALIEENITSLEATKILSAANNNIELIKEKYDISKSMNNIDNLVGWLIRAVKENYQAPVNKRKKDPFIDREQASYDLDKIEKVLLGLEHYEDEKDSDTKKEIQMIQDMIKENITEDNAIALLVESNHNIELIKQKYEISKLINNIDDRAKWIIEQLKAERLKNTKS